jgi:Kef-type K+ transport system membrane component KefB
MHSESVIFYIFLIFTGAAVLATLALYARQSLLVVYILLGVLLGPSGLNWVSDPEVIGQISHIGIIFLLFLLGINLPPQKLVLMLRETTLVTGVSSLLFLIIGGSCALLFGFNLTESFVIGAAMMFSSTIIGLKLLPTTVLHHQHIGEIIISILLMQDIIAILILMLLPAEWKMALPILEIIQLILSLFGLIAFAFVVERYVLIKLIQRFDRIREYIFLVTIGWCLGLAELASILGLSAEIGAFIAGITLATNPIAMFIGESLKPLRDFFLIIFFFAVGASFDLQIVEDVVFPGLIIAVMALLLKPYIFKLLLAYSGEPVAVGMEVGVRLGQISEFSLLISVLALELGVISQKASYLIQLSTIITFIISSYLVVMKYPSPIAITDKLRRD